MTYYHQRQKLLLRLYRYLTLRHWMKYGNKGYGWWIKLFILTGVVAGKRKRVFDWRTYLWWSIKYGRIDKNNKKLYKHRYSRWKK